jgi:O-antigen biosynthesis protein
LLVSPFENSQTQQAVPAEYFLKCKMINNTQEDLLASLNGSFTIICQAGDRFLPTLLHLFYLHLMKATETDLFYYDCEVQKSAKSSIPLFKPKTPSPALCLSYNLFSRGLIRTSLLKQVLNNHSLQRDLTLIEYEVCLRLLERNAKIKHIPAVLVSQKKLPKPDTPEAQQILLNFLNRAGLQDPSAKPTSQGIHFIWQHDNPSLSIIIPTKNNVKFLKHLIQSLKKHHYNLSININIVDNGSNEPDTLAYYCAIESDPQIEILPYKKTFNYSEAINLGVRQSNSDLVLLMNDDMMPINADWLAEMIQWAQRDEIGVVGAKLLRSNRTLQHAGIIMGLVGFVGHIYLNAPEDYFGLWGSADWTRDILAVTGACQMMRRDIFDKVEGYDEGFRLAFGDIDFCLRVHQQGFRNIYTPFARLYHYEGRSRGYITPVDDILKGYQEFEPYLNQGDPFFNPNLTYSRIPKCFLAGNSTETRQKQIAQRQAFYKNND